MTGAAGAAGGEGVGARRRLRWELGERGQAWSAPPPAGWEPWLDRCLKEVLGRLGLWREHAGEPEEAPALRGPVCVCLRLGDGRTVELDGEPRGDDGHGRPQYDWRVTLPDGPGPALEAPPEGPALWVQALGREDFEALAARQDGLRCLLLAPPLPGRTRPPGRLALAAWSFEPPADPGWQPLLAGEGVAAARAAGEGAAGEGAAGEGAAEAREGGAGPGVERAPAEAPVTQAPGAGAGQPVEGPPATGRGTRAGAALRAPGARAGERPTRLVDRPEAAEGGAGPEPVATTDAYGPRAPAPARPRGAPGWLGPLLTVLSVPVVLLLVGGVVVFWQGAPALGLDEAPVDTLRARLAQARAEAEGGARGLLDEAADRWGRRANVPGPAAPTPAPALAPSEASAPTAAPSPSPGASPPATEAPPSEAAPAEAPEEHGTRSAPAAGKEGAGKGAPHPREAAAAERAPVDGVHGPGAAAAGEGVGLGRPETPGRGAPRGADADDPLGLAAALDDEEEEGGDELGEAWGEAAGGPPPEAPNEQAPGEATPPPPPLPEDDVAAGGG